MSIKRSICMIPALTAVGAVLPACSDPVLGDWEVTRLAGDVLPKSNTEDGSVYTYSASLKFEADGDVDIVKTKTVTGAKTGTKAYVYTGSWTNEGKRNYMITLENSLWSCTLDSKEIECDDERGDRVLEAVPAR